MSFENPSPQLDAEMLIGVAEGLDIVLISQDELLVQFGTRSTPSQLFRDPNLTGLLARIMHPILEGPCTLGDLLAKMDSEAEAASEQISDFLSQGILADLRTSPVDQYLKYTFTGDSSLSTRRVALIGAGPIGARIADGVLRHGVGSAVLLDNRPVDPVWNRFAPFGADVGNNGQSSSADQLRRHLMRSGHGGVEVVRAELDEQGVAEAVADADLVVLALEQPDILLSHLVNRTCLKVGKPWLQAQIDGNIGLAGPLFVLPHTACYNCFKALADAATPSRDMARKHRQHIQSRGRPSFFPGLPAYVDIVAGFSSLAIVHYLLRESSFAVGRVLVCNFDQMLLDIEDVLKLPRCPVCAVLKGNYLPAVSVDIAEAPGSRSAGGENELTDHNLSQSNHRAI